MDYLEFAKYYEEVSSTSKRLEKIEITSEFLKKIEDSEFVYLLLGEIYPEYDERKMGVSEQLVIKAISNSTGESEESVVGEWKRVGDLGEVAEIFIKDKKQSTLGSSEISVQKVLDNLRKITTLSGVGAVRRKIGLISELLTSAKPLEGKYIVRTLLGDLRIGIQESSVRDSVSLAFFNGEEDSKEIIQRAIDKTNDWKVVFDIARKGNIGELEKIEIVVGTPIKVMLAQKANGIEEGFEIVGKPCAIEYKYDGFRLVVHKKGEEVTLFTRKLENVTRQFPEVEKYVKETVLGDSFILDCEGVGFDRESKKYTSFQAISQRIRRKYDIDELAEKLPIELSVFDILYYENKSLLDVPFKERSELLRKIVKDVPYKIVCSKQIVTGDLNEAKLFYEDALEKNQEGVMMKSLDAPYRPGKRVGQMIKIKPDENEMDLVITGAEYGTGKRSGWMSSFILSCRNGEDYLEVGRVGTGIKEKTEEGVSFEELTEALKPLILKEDGKGVLVRPSVVVSVSYQEIQKSSNYSSGFALRFPRAVSLRLDRNIFDIASLEEVEDNFRKQSFFVLK